MVLRLCHQVGAITKNLNRIASTEVFCGATGNRTRDTRIFSPLLYQLSYGTKFFFRTSLSFDWDCKGRHFFLICKFKFKIFDIFLIRRKGVA